MAELKICFASGKLCGYLVIICAVLVGFSHVTACPMGYYGERCDFPCSDHCITMECQNLTGVCLGGCRDGYHGEKCLEACSEGSYGANCSLTCQASCPGHRCDHTSGVCLETCPPGRRGPWCDEGCQRGSFGPGCNQSCPRNCANSDCHPESGYCLSGCIINFWGSDCSLHGEFKDNPTEKKREFYKHLSAESKSVLLYILMGDYERSLRQAQAEIDTGIQLRNELRNLIGG